MFNDYGKVIVSTEVSPDASYKILDISSEYEIVTQPDLARCASDKYQNMALLYDRVLRHRQIRVNKLLKECDHSSSMMRSVSISSKENREMPMPMRLKSTYKSMI